MRENNFNLIRLFAASLVMLSHHFALSGQKEPGFLGINTVGGFCVSVFFVVSGYLISKSWDRDPNIKSYLSKRIYRIFPALIIHVFLVVIFLGIFASKLRLREYFTSATTYNYLYNIILYPQYFLPGVFTENTYPNTVNGSLWTLCVEFLMYLYVMFFGLLISNRKYFYITSFFIFLALSLYYPATSPVYKFNINILKLFPLGTFFFAGCCFNYLKLESYTSGALVAFLSFMLIIASAIDTKFCEFLSYFILPIIVMSFSLGNWKYLNDKIKHNDISYGVYIYGFVVQQLIAGIFGGYLDLIVSIIITGFLGFASWKLVEQRWIYKK